MNTNDRKPPIASKRTGLSFTPTYAQQPPREIFVFGPDDVRKATSTVIFTKSTIQQQPSSIGKVNDREDDDDDDDLTPMQEAPTPARHNLTTKSSYATNDTTTELDRPNAPRQTLSQCQAKKFTFDGFTPASSLVVDDTRDDENDDDAEDDGGGSVCVSIPTGHEHITSNSNRKPSQILDGSSKGWTSESKHFLQQSINLLGGDNLSSTNPYCRPEEMINSPTVGNKQRSFESPSSPPASDDEPIISSKDPEQDDSIFFDMVADGFIGGGEHGAAMTYTATGNCYFCGMEGAPFDDEPLVSTTSQVPLATHEGITPGQLHNTSSTGQSDFELTDLLFETTTAETMERNDPAAMDDSSVREPHDDANGSSSIQNINQENKRQDMGNGLEGNIAPACSDLTEESPNDDIEKQHTNKRDTSGEDEPNACPTAGAINSSTIDNPTNTLEAAVHPSVDHQSPAYCPLAPMTTTKDRFPPKHATLEECDEQHDCFESPPTVPTMATTTATHGDGFSLLDQEDADSSSASSSSASTPHSSNESRDAGAEEVDLLEEDLQLDTTRTNDKMVMGGHVVLVQDDYDIDNTVLTPSSRRTTTAEASTEKMSITYETSTLQALDDSLCDTLHLFEFWA